MDNFYKFNDGRKLRIGTMFCIGKNYAEHAREMGGDTPKNIVVFLKPPQAYVENDSTIRLPEMSENVHYETELVIVIGEDCDNVEIEEASKFIAGYGIGLDLTMRDVQMKAKEKGHPWAISKGFAGSAPISEIIPFNGEKFPEFQISLKVNGQTKQNDSSSKMQRSVEMLISELSKIFGLRKGDLIFTGTPKGVGPVKKGDELIAELSNDLTLKLIIG